jgi:SAM-dependent methyltransferase
MQATVTELDLDEIKQKQQATWASGDYARIGTTLQLVGESLCEAADVYAGAAVLDVAAGNGNASLAAARRGAVVTASDYVEDLLQGTARRAEAEGADITTRVADAEALPFDDGSYDVVLSTFGVMFVPHPERAAAELVRVCRPGGRIGLISWTPTGFVGEMFRTMKPYAPPPPPGAQPPPLWGDEDHVRALLGDRVTDIVTRRQTVTVGDQATPEAWRDFWKTVYGPTIVAYRNIADDPQRVAALDRDLAALAARFDRGTGAIVMDWEYLLLTARRA